MTRLTQELRLYNKPNYFGALVIWWLFFLIYFLVNNIESFILFLILPPVFIFMFHVALSKRYVVMSMFFALVFISQAINPAFFFLNKNDFINAPAWAVDDFNFDLPEFFFAYKDMYLLLICIFIFTLVLNRIFVRPRLKITIEAKDTQSNRKKSKKQSVLTKQNGMLYAQYIYLLMVFIAIPLNFFMYTHGVGISTVEPEHLPFKLVGITFYVRNYIIPVLLMYLYFKSTRTRMLSLLILLYGMLVGILSLSKGNILLTLSPVILFSYLDGHKLRLFISVMYGIFLYLFVSWARQFVFISDIGSLDMIINIFSHVSENDFFDWNILPNFFAAISDRLYGAQYTLLANQFDLADNVQETLNFLIANTDHLSQIIYTEVFRLPIFDGVVVGVNIGYLNILILLANKNLLLLTFLALVTALYLTVAELIIYKYISMNKYFGLIGYPLAFFMVFFLFDGVIGKFYFVFMLSVIGLFLIKLLPPPLLTKLAL